jgi:hypothetical protein
MNDRYTADTINDDALDQLYERLDRARDAAALHRQGLLTTAELYAVIEATPAPGPAATQATEPHTGLVVQPYRNDRGENVWVFRCWGTDDGCDGWLSLDHYSEQSAERARDRHAAEEHGAPAPEATEPADIQLTRKLGHGLIVDNAPPRARKALADHANTGWGARVQGADCINIGDQVLYQVTGYNPASASLLLELVEDWRPAVAPEPPKERCDCPPTNAGLDLCPACPGRTKEQQL